MSMPALVLLKISMNSSLPPAGPRKRNSLITTGVETVPTPDNATVADEPPVVAIVNVACRTPPAVGANVTSAVVDAPAPSVVVAGAPAENFGASAPLTVGVVNTIGVALTLVSVTVWVAVVPAGTKPKSIVGGAAVRTTGGGAIVTVKLPVPLQPLVAVAWTVNVNEPVAVGVPARTPPLPRVRPVGAVPLAAVNVYGASPPAAVTVPE